MGRRLGLEGRNAVQVPIGSWRFTRRQKNLGGWLGLPRNEQEGPFVQELGKRWQKKGVRKPQQVEESQCQ